MVSQTMRFMSRFLLETDITLRIGNLRMSSGVSKAFCKSGEGNVAAVARNAILDTLPVAGILREIPKANQISVFMDKAATSHSKRKRDCLLLPGM